MTACERNGVVCILLRGQLTVRMPRLLARILKPFSQLLIRVASVRDPWERIDTAPRLRAYGSGARLEFDHYLRGDSAVAVESLEHLQDWLLGCEYAPDETLFAESDFWQHPSTFERMRAGDCEDFALWAWRKLIELGYDADFVAGYCVKDDDLDGRHAWVMVRREGVEYLFEPAARSKERMMFALDSVRDRYIPQFGADRHARRFAYAGYLLSLSKRSDTRREPAAPPT